MHIWSGHEKEVQEILSKYPQLRDLHCDVSKTPPEPLHNWWPNLHYPSNELYVNVLGLAFHARQVKIAAYLYGFYPLLFYWKAHENSYSSPFRMINRSTSQEEVNFFSSLLATGAFDKSLFTIHPKKSIFFITYPDFSFAYELAYMGSIKPLEAIFKRIITPLADEICKHASKSFPIPVANILVGYLSYDHYQQLKDRINSIADSPIASTRDESHTLLSVARKCEDTELRISLTTFLLHAGADPDAHIKMLDSMQRSVKASIRYMHKIKRPINCGYENDTKATALNEEFTEILRKCGKSTPSTSAILPQKPVERHSSSGQDCNIQ